MKVLKLFSLAAVLFLLTSAPAMAQEVKPTGSVTFSGTGLGMGLGMGFTIIGAAYGFGKIGSAAMESMARQPEVAPRIGTSMLIIAAMLEGAALSSVILCFVIGFLKPTI